jgi:hypothetical protein
MTLVRHNTWKSHCYHVSKFEHKTNSLHEICGRIYDLSSYQFPYVRLQLFIGYSCGTETDYRSIRKSDKLPRAVFKGLFPSLNVASVAPPQKLAQSPCWCYRLLRIKYEDEVRLNCMTIIATFIKVVRWLQSYSVGTHIRTNGYTHVGSIPRDTSMMYGHMKPSL